MGHKRKQIRKLKKKLTRKAKQPKQAVQMDMLKLMALMGNNKPGQQPSVDPATFLQQQEKKAERENEIRKLKEQTKSIKNANANAKDEHALNIARAELDRARMEGNNYQELLEVQEQAAGIKGEIRNLNIKKAEAEHRIRMNTEHGDLEALKAQRDALQKDLQKVMKSINNKMKKKLTPEIQSVLSNANNKMKQFNNALKDLEKAVIMGVEVNVKRNLVNKKADELDEGMNELLELNQQLQFDIKQDQDTIEIGEDRIRRYEEEKKKNTRLLHEARTSKLAAENAGYLYNRDKDGKVVQTYDEKLLKPLFKPEETKKFKELDNEVQQIITFLNQKLEKQNWDEIACDNTGKFNKWLKEQNGKFIITALNTTFKGNTIGDLDNLLNILKSTVDLREKARAEAQKRLDKVIEYNNKIKALPKLVKTEITEDMIVGRELENQELQNEIEKNRRLEQHKKKLEVEYDNLVHDINRLEAEVNANNPEEITKEQLKLLAQLKKQKQELERMLEVRNKRKRRIEQMQDQADDMEFENRVNSGKLNESPRSKKAREDAEDEAIKAKLAAEQQNELITQKGMTQKSERDRRMAQSKENIMHSDEIKESEQKIEDEMFNRMKTEQETERLEKLTNLEKQTRDAKVTLSMKRRLDEHMQESTGVEDTLTQLEVIKEQTVREGKHYDEIRSKVRKFGERFRTNPYEFEQFNIWAEYDGKCNTFDSVDELIAQTETDEHIGVISEFFDKWDGGYFDKKEEE